MTTLPTNTKRMEEMRKYYEDNFIHVEKYNMETGEAKMDWTRFVYNPYLPKQVWSWFQSHLLRVQEEARDQEREKIHQLFIKYYKGCGEVFFPYESEDICVTDSDAIDFVNSEWTSLLTQK